MSIPSRDLRLMLRLVARPDDAEGPEPMPWSILFGLRDLIGCEIVTFMLHDTPRCTVPFIQDLVPDFPPRWMIRCLHAGSLQHCSPWPRSS